MAALYAHVNPKNKKHSPLISKQTYDIIMKNADVSDCWCTNKNTLLYINTVSMESNYIWVNTETFKIPLQQKKIVLPNSILVKNTEVRKVGILKQPEENAQFYKSTYE